MKLGFSDWEIWHNKGLCYMYLKEYAEAIDCFEQANDVQRHDATYVLRRAGEHGLLAPLTPPPPRAGT